MICHIFGDSLWWVFSGGIVLVLIGGAFAFVAIVLFIYNGFGQKPGKHFAIGIYFVFWFKETLIVIHGITCTQIHFTVACNSIYLHLSVKRYVGEVIFLTKQCVAKIELVIERQCIFRLDFAKWSNRHWPMHFQPFAWAESKSFQQILPSDPNGDHYNPMF